jgi:hypothetical protein
MCGHPDRLQLQVVLHILDQAGAEIAAERWEMCPQCLAVWSDRLAEALTRIDEQERSEAHRDRRHRR